VDSELLVRWMQFGRAMKGAGIWLLPDDFHTHNPRLGLDTPGAVQCLEYRAMRKRARLPLYRIAPVLLGPLALALASTGP